MDAKVIPVDPPVLFSIEDLLEHVEKRPVGSKLRDFHPPVGELFFHVGKPHPYLLELGVIYVAGLISIIFGEQLLLLYF